MPKQNEIAPYVVRQPGSPFYWVSVPIPRRVQHHPLLLNKKGKPQKRLKQSLKTDSARQAAEASKSIVVAFKHRIATAMDSYSPDLHAAARYRARLKDAQTDDERVAILTEWQERLEQLLPPLSPRHEGSFKEFQYIKQKESLSTFVEGGLPNVLVHYPEAASIPTIQYLEDFIHHKAKNDDDATKKRASIERIAAKFPILSLITKGALTTWFAEMVKPKDSTKPLAWGTVSYIRTHGRQYWDYLDKRGVKGTEGINPFVASGMPDKPAKAEIQYLPFTLDEASAIYDHALHKQEGKYAGDGTMATIIAIAAYTGAREGAICKARIEHFNLTAGAQGDLPPHTWVILEDKTDAGRRLLPLHTSLIEVLRRWIGNKTEGPLFPGITANAVGKRFHRIVRDKLGLPERKVFHSWRHTAIQRCKVNKVPGTEAAFLFGHATKLDGSYHLYGETEVKDARPYAHHLAKLDYKGPLGGNGLILPPPPKVD